VSMYYEPEDSESDDEEFPVFFAWTTTTTPASTESTCSHWQFSWLNHGHRCHQCGPNSER